jgi:hypothetical protein
MYVSSKNTDNRNSTIKSLRSFKLIRLNNPLNTERSIPFDNNKKSKLQILNYDCLEQMLYNIFENRPIFSKRYHKTHNYFDADVYMLISKLFFRSEPDYGYIMTNKKTLAETILEKNISVFEISSAFKFINFDDKENIKNFLVFLMNYPEKLTAGVIDLIVNRHLDTEFISSFENIIETKNFDVKNFTNYVKNLTKLSKKIPSLKNLALSFILLCPYEFDPIDGIESIDLLTSSAFLRDVRLAYLGFFNDSYVQSLRKNISHFELTNKNSLLVHEIFYRSIKKITDFIKKFEDFASIRRIFEITDDLNTFIGLVNVLIWTLIYAKLYPYNIKDEKLKMQLVPIFNVIITQIVNKISGRTPLGVSFGYGTNIITYIMYFFVANSEYFNVRMDLDSINRELFMMKNIEMIDTSVRTRIDLYRNFLFTLLNRSVPSNTNNNISTWKNKWSITLNSL